MIQILDEQWTAANSDRDVLRQAFAKFDETQEGYIDIEQFRTVMSTLGEPLTDEELEEFIQLGLSEDQTTKINIECKLLSSLRSHSAARFSAQISSTNYSVTMADQYSVLFPSL